MGILGPLTAQALGRSPFDDVVPGQTPPDEELGRARELDQQYDAKGRPINPRTKQINRDLVRAHNEVMQVIGVAEPDTPVIDHAANARLRHYTHESTVGRRIAMMGMYCVGSVGVFGITGFRERVLTYKRYSHVTVLDMFQEMGVRAREVFSGRLPVGMASNLVKDYADHKTRPLLPKLIDRPVLYWIATESWLYVRTHLTLWATSQRLGLVPSNQLLPPLSYFIPYSSTSPMTPPPPLKDFSASSIMQWTFQCAINAVPFLLWSLTLEAYKYISIQAWPRFIQGLPSTMFQSQPEILPDEQGDTQTARPASQVGEPQSEQNLAGYDSGTQEFSHSDYPESPQEQVPEHASMREDVSVLEGVIHEAVTANVREEDVMRPRSSDNLSDRDDVQSEFEDAPEVGPTLISFDVEPSDSMDVPHQGMWSAELRQSTGPEYPEVIEAPLVYFNSVLTQVAPMLAAHLLSDAFTGLIIAPLEALALRELAIASCQARGIGTAHIYNLWLWEGFSLRALANFLLAELLHVAAQAEVFAICSALAMHYHYTEEQWAALERGGVQGTPGEESDEIGS